MKAIGPFTEGSDLDRLMTRQSGQPFMNRFSALAIGLGSVLLLSEASAFAKIKVIIERNTGENATMDFKFPTIPRPARFDAATVASVTLLGGELDPACGGLNSLTDGKLPEEADSPEENFFFQAATEGGRVRFDLNRLVDVKEINTYSWHPGSRAPQVYNLYASDGKSSHFIPRPEGKSDPEKCGWKKLAWVDTRPKSGDSGGQYAVSITGSIGKVQYLL